MTKKLTDQIEKILEPYIDKKTKELLEKYIIPDFFDIYYRRRQRAKGRSELK